MHWRIISIVLAVVTLVLAAALITGRVGTSTAPGAPAAAISGPLLAGEIAVPGQPPLAVAYEGVSGKLRISHSGLGGNGQSAVLWLGDRDGKVYPMGVIWNGDGSTAITLAPGDRRRMINGATLQVSLEPGSTPPAQPTTPIVARGILTAL